jgi:hypothetical protein
MHCNKGSHQPSGVSRQENYSGLCFVMLRVSRDGRCGINLRKLRSPLEIQIWNSPSQAFPDG